MSATLGSVGEIPNAPAKSYVRLSTLGRVEWVTAVEDAVVLSVAVVKCKSVVRETEVQDTDTGSTLISL